MTPVFRRPQTAVGDRSGWHLASAQLLFALTVIAVTAITVLSYDKLVRNTAERQLQDTADLGQVFLTQQNIGVAAVISSTMKAADVNAALQMPNSARSKAVIQRTLDTLSASGPDISSVSVTDSHGRLISALPGRLPAGYDLSQRAWFRKGSVTGTFSVAPVFESLVVNGSYLTSISVPVRRQANPNSPLLGVVSVALRLDGFQRFVDAYARHRDVRLSVLDGSGAVVAASGASAFDVGGTVAARAVAGRKLLSGTKGQLTAISSEPAERAAPGGTEDDWRVVSQVSEASAMQPAVFFRAVAVATGGLILIAAFLITWIRRRAARAGRDAARHLAQSQLRMHDLANSSSNLLFRLSSDGTVIFASRASAKILGQRSDQLLGRDLLALVVAEQAPDAHSRLRMVIEDGDPQVFLARTTGADGFRRMVECSLRVGQGDDASEIWGSLHDVTDRRSASDQVEQLFQLSEDFMAVIGFDGLLVQTNPIWSGAFELSQEHLLGLRFEQMFQPEDYGSVTGVLARLASVPAVATFETRYQRGDRLRTLLWTAAPDPDRRLIYAVGRDITDHKELQRALAQTRDQALEASRLKSEFVATMSHEIRTPMNGVIGLTDLLLGTELDLNQRRYVEGVRIAGDALLSVINDILDFSKIEAGRMVLDTIDFRLEEVVDDVVTLVRQSALAKNLELTVEFRPGVPFALNGDPGRLRQVLLNLAHNAVKFTEQGGVSLLVEPGATRPDGRVSVIFTVADTGIGIDPGRLEELFQPFRQAHEGPTRAYGGTGLGLSICRRLADLMAGSISASSELGRGASFVAELVFTSAADWGRPVRGPDARGLAVLVVDDNEVNRLVMITQLTRWGMRPVAASSAAQALELLTRHSAPAGGYDLAVIDTQLQADGLTLVRQLRSIPALKRLPVILLTSDDSLDLELAQEYRISARLSKPVQQSDLFDALTRVAMPGVFTGTSTARPRPPTAPAPSVASTVEAFTEAVTPTVVPASIVVAAAAAEVPGPVRVVDVVPFQLLLVEDNDINQTVALGILTQLGYQVDIAADGIQAVAMAAQHAYDAILMDCQMPRLDGYAATIEIRKRPATRATPIIAMTAATFAADRLRCFDSGMDDFIAKPVRAATLQATLNRWLRPDPSSPQSDSDSGSGSGSDASGSEASSSEGSGSGDVGPETPGAEAVRFAKAVPEPRAEQVVRAEVAERAEAAQLRAARWPQAQPEVSARRPADTRIEAPPVPMPVGGIGESAGTEQRIRELLGGGSQIEIDLVHEIISSFLSRTVDLFQLLTLAVAARDADAVHLHAHSMAGAGLNLGTVQVAQISRQIEADAKAGRPALSVPRLVELQLALDQARIILRDLAANLPAAPPEG